MINLNEQTARLQLQAITDRINESEAAHDIAQGTWRPQDDYLLPEPHNDTRKSAWRRALRQMQTLGPRIMHTKLGAAIGAVTWGGDTDEVDEELSTLDLPELSRRMGAQLIVDGITAGLAHDTLDPEGNPTGETRITRLGGYLQPYTDPMDVDRVTGLFQAWSRSVTRDETLMDQYSDFGRTDNKIGNHATRWTVRIYDWSDGEDRATLREWRNLTDPTHVGATADLEIENAPVPRLAIVNTTNDGLPLGELLQAAPQLMALWATEARLTLSEELSAFPMLVMKGGEVEAIGPGEPIALDVDGDVYWSDPGNLEELRSQRTLRLERLREDLALPGGFLGNDSPSGEAFREANVRFRQSSESYAVALEDLLTRLVDDFAILLGVDAAPVSISPSKEYDFDSRAQWIIKLYQANIIPLQVAATEIQPYFGTWDDEALNEWVEEQTARVSVDDLRAELGGE